MSKKITTARMDDLTGEPAARRVVFGLDRHVYEIDLAEVSESVLREALAPYINAGTVIGGIRSRATGSGGHLTGRPIVAHGQLREALSDVYQ